MKFVNTVLSTKTIIFLLIAFNTNFASANPFQQEMKFLKKWSKPNKKEQTTSLPDQLSLSDQQLLDSIQEPATQQIIDSVSLGQAGLLKKKVKKKAAPPKKNNRKSTRRIRSR